MNEVTITERMVPVACDLVDRVRSGNRPGILALFRSLNGRERYALVVVLAAMIPVDRSARELLAWTDGGASEPGTTNLRPCGTHAAYWRHKAHGEPVDWRCLHAERAYQRARKRRRRENVA